MRSDPAYKETARPNTEKSHQRQLVDGSDPTYKETLAPKPRNPTNGSWWMVQIQPKTGQQTPRPSQLSHS
jgi:hypothetical protein